MSETSFLPSHVLVTAPDVTPSRWMFVLHGILGSGTNFRGFAKRVAAAVPSWGFVLPDLRMHGQSQGAPPPHTLASAADDLRRLADRLPSRPVGVMGHSFGGKVALAYAEREAPRLEQLWVLDASPSATTPEARVLRTSQVVRLLRAGPQPLATREQFFAICADHGLDRGMAEWLAMNLRRADDGFRLRLDLDAVDALLADYFARDLWHVLEDPRYAVHAHVVVGGRSDALTPDERARLAARAAVDPRLEVATLEGAGHWVHVDAPDALLDVVVAGLRA